MSYFNGKSVRVLGGSRGIGAAIVRRFAEEGAKVVFTYAGSSQAARQLVSKRLARCRKVDASSSWVRSMAIACRCPVWRPTP